jgi:hypothetical protein
MTAAKKNYVLVKSTSPRPTFRRAGFMFTAEWRALELGDTDDVDKDVVGPESLARIKAEANGKPPMLAWMPATAEQIEQIEKDRAALVGKDPTEVIAMQNATIADLQARLMKLELVGKKNDKGADK